MLKRHYDIQNSLTIVNMRKCCISVNLARLSELNVSGHSVYFTDTTIGVCSMLGRVFTA